MLAEARENRTHRTRLSTSPNGFEARGSHQAPFTSQPDKLTEGHEKCQDGHWSLVIGPWQMTNDQ